MKKIISIITLLGLLLSSSACHQNTTVPSDTTLPSISATTTPTATTEPTVHDYQFPLLCVSVPVTADKYLTEDSTLIFTHTYQNMEFLIENPVIAEKVTQDFQNRQAFEQSPAWDILEAAKADYAGQSDWIPYLFSIVYNPVRLDENILSLFGTEVIFNGNIRSTSINRSVSYDLFTGDVLTLPQILAADFSADELGQLIIEALDPLAQEGLLYYDYAYVISEMLSTNRQIDTWYFSETGLCFYFAPYEIAPPSTGTVIAEIPYHKLTQLLQDQYFPAEQFTSTGTAVVTVFNDDDTSHLTQFAELTLDVDGEELLLYTQGTIQDVRLEIGIWLDNNTFRSDAVVMAAATLCPGDAVILRASSGNIANMRLTYQSGNTLISQKLTVQ